MSCALTRNNCYIHEYRGISKGNEWKGRHKTYAIIARPWNLTGKPNLDMILKNSLWRQKTEKKEQGLLERVRTPYHTSRCTTHYTAMHIQPHGTLYHTAHPAAPHITPLWTSRHSTHTTALHIPPQRTYHSAAHPAAPHIPRRCTSYPSHCMAHRTTLQSHHNTHPTAQHSLPRATFYCTAHPTARPAKANVLPVLKPGHLLFTRPPCLAMTEDSSTH